MEPNALAFSSSTIKHMDHSFIPLLRDGISPGVNGWSSILLCRRWHFLKVAHWLINHQTIEASNTQSNNEEVQTLNVTYGNSERQDESNNDGFSNVEKAQKKRKHGEAAPLAPPSTNPTPTNPIAGEPESLPNVVLEEIFCQRGHWLNVKQCRKEYLDVAEDDHVYRHKSLEKLPLVSLAWFLKRCKESGNAEIVYCEAI
ncbi:hypothetical protein JHK87_047453 [Glycine soja]|nr:hypothetical protein JHK87_047453 [Glycine soja]